MKLDFDKDGDKNKYNNSGETKTKPGDPEEFDVLFPYDRIYPEQQQYIECAKRALHEKGHGLIEVPPGTNQSLCLLSLLTSYQQQNSAKPPNDTHRNGNNSLPLPRRRIVYATNSAPETRRVIGEVAIVMNHRQQQQQQQSSTTSTSHKNKKRKQQSHLLFDNVEGGFWKSTTTTDDPNIRNIDHYNDSHAGNSSSFPFLALCLTGFERDAIDDACRRANAGDDEVHRNDPLRFRCSMTDSENPPPNGIFYSLKQLHDWAFPERPNGQKSGIGNNHGNNDVDSMDIDSPFTTKVSTGRWCCFQHLIKYAIHHANVLVVTYPYLLDPMTAMMIGNAIYDVPQLKNNKDGDNKENDKSSNNNTTAIKSEELTNKTDAIVVFDHAHNIDAACVDALSATVNLQDLEQATRSLDKLSAEISRLSQHRKQQQQQRLNSSSETPDIKTEDNNSNNKCDDIPRPLKDEYDDLVGKPIDHGMYRPILFPSEDVVNEPVPGNIRRMKHFIGCMKKIVEHFKVRLRWATETKRQPTTDNKSKKKKMGTGTVSPLAFLHQMMNATALDSKTLRFVYSRVVSMLRTLNVSRETFTELINVAYVTSLLGFTNTLESSKFAIVLEQTSVVIGHHAKYQPQNHHNSGGGNGVYGSNTGSHDEGRRSECLMMLQVACLDPSLAIKPIFDRFETVLLTSSTLSPIHFYPKILQFEPVVVESIPMSTIRPSVNPIMISRGSDQLIMSTGYKERFTMGCIRNYGKMLVDLVSTIPDGVVVYFPSYSYMEALICEWDAIGIMREMTEWKLVFVETKDNLELNTIALDNYRASCDIGRGGVFFSVARGNISEAIPFDLHYGRAVVMIGIPYEYTLSKVVRARLEYIQTHFDIREQDYLTFDALRQVAKCFGRVIRSKIDYGVFVFADSRFHRNDKKTKLPGWISQFLAEGQQDLTTDMAVAQIKSFLRQTGQPVDQKLLQNLLAHG